MTDQFFGITDTGKQRQNNEDVFIAQLSSDQQFIIACVIDGVGGYDGGEIAAALAKETILEILSASSADIIPMLRDCFYAANDEIEKEKQRLGKYPYMACVCTLALVDITGNQFYFAHVGDSRLYLVRDNSLVKISHDQSFVGFLEDSGRLSEEEAMKHPKRNEISKALGLDKNIKQDPDYVETGQSPFLSGDLLLLCSDGLTDMVDAGTIQAIVTTDVSLETKCQELVDAANKNGGRDNVTAVLVQNKNALIKYDPAKPVPNKKNTTINPAEVLKKLSEVTEDQPVTKTNNTLIIILFVLMLFFLGTSIRLYLKGINRPVVAVANPVKKAKSSQEIKLQRAIDQAKGKILLLSDTAFTSPIILSQSIQINKDSLIIKARGKIVLLSDTGYNGPAFQLSLNCKNIVLDSLSFSNFQVGILAFNSALALKNTRFINCQVQVQNILLFPDKKYISGKLPATPFKADSIPVNTKNK